MLQKTIPIMDQNVYRPPSNFEHSPDRSQNGSFGEFNFDKAFELGWVGFTRNIGLSLGVEIVWFILIFLATISCVGIPLALPHFTAAASMFGLAMVRQKLDFNVLFVGFQQYGKILGAVLLMGLVYMSLAIIFYLPLLGVLFASGGIEALEELDNNDFDAANQSGLLLIVYLFQYIQIPLQMYFTGRFMLVYPLILERQLGPVEAMKVSWAVTGPQHWMILLFQFVVSLVTASGMILCGIGILFSIPLGLAIQGAGIHLFLDNPGGGKEATEEGPTTLLETEKGEENPYH